MLGSRSRWPGRAFVRASALLPALLPCCPPCDLRGRRRHPFPTDGTLSSRSHHEVHNPARSIELPTCSILARRPARPRSCHPRKVRCAAAFTGARHAVHARPEPARVSRTRCTGPPARTRPSRYTFRPASYRMPASRAIEAWCWHGMPLAVALPALPHPAPAPLSLYPIPTHRSPTCHKVTLDATAGTLNLEIAPPAGVSPGECGTQGLLLLARWAVRRAHAPLRGCAPPGMGALLAAVSKAVTSAAVAWCNGSLSCRHPQRLLLPPTLTVSSAPPPCLLQPSLVTRLRPSTETQPSSRHRCCGAAHLGASPSPSLPPALPTSQTAHTLSPPLPSTPTAPAQSATPGRGSASCEFLAPASTGAALVRRRPPASAPAPHASAAPQPQCILPCPAALQPSCCSRPAEREHHLRHRQCRVHTPCWQG